MAQWQLQFEVTTALPGMSHFSRPTLRQCYQPHRDEISAMLKTLCLNPDPMKHQPCTSLQQPPVEPRRSIRSCCAPRHLQYFVGLPFKHGEEGCHIVPVSRDGIKRRCTRIVAILFTSVSQWYSHSICTNTYFWDMYDHNSRSDAFYRSFWFCGLTQNIQLKKLGLFSSSLIIFYHFPT